MYLFCLSLKDPSSEHVNTGAGDQHKLFAHLARAASNARDSEALAA